MNNTSTSNWCLNDVSQEKLVCLKSKLGFTFYTTASVNLRQALSLYIWGDGNQGRVGLWLEVKLVNQQIASKALPCVSDVVID